MKLCYVLKAWVRFGLVPEDALVIAVLAGLDPSNASAALNLVMLLQMVRLCQLWRVALHGTCVPFMLRLMLTPEAGVSKVADACKPSYGMPSRISH